MEQLPADRCLAYTSVSTILRILEQKQILSTEKIGRQHLYKPTVTKQKFTTHFVNKVVKQIFSGRSIELVAHLVGKHKFSADEITAIQKILDDKKKEI
jgi:predicted transcriptional regulator